MFSRAAKSAASFSILARSAPENPGVFSANERSSTSLASGLFLACTLRIASRPFTSGVETLICLSKRPGLLSALSNTSARLVAAITIIPFSPSNPSISTRSWLRVCSRSSFPPPTPLPRLRPTASISSIKIIQGAFFSASLNKSRTRLAPTPTNISTKSDPEIEKNGTFASPATARANKVFPVPGGPSNNTPLGILAPILVNLR